MWPGVTSSAVPGPQEPAGPLLTHLQVLIKQALILSELTVLLPAPQLLSNLGDSQSAQRPLLPLGLQVPGAWGRETRQCPYLSSHHPLEVIIPTFQTRK